MSETTAQPTDQQLEKLSKLVAKALKREVPILSDAELSDYHRSFYHLRSEFSAWCVSHQMYYTLALLTTCEIRMDHRLPAIAALSANGKKLEVIFHPLVIELWEKDKHSAYFLFCHELRHIVQASSLRAVEELVDVEPFREVFVEKQKIAETQEAKDQWQKIIDDIDDKENQKWKQKRHMIANVTMDAALHQDVLHMFPSVSPSVNEFLRERFSPYMSGFTFETIAKDSVTAGTHKQELEQAVEHFGPQKMTALDSFRKQASPTPEQELTFAMKQNVHIQTVPSLIDSMSSIPGFQTTLTTDEKYEWLQIADEYVRWLAFQMKEDLDPNQPPQQGEGSDDLLDQFMQQFSQFDSHEFGDGSQSKEQREEMERKVRDAVRRAQQEGKAMAHRAGHAIGDAEMMGDSTETLNKKIHEALQKMKIKFVRIFAETNKKRYSFDRINRLFSEVSYLPGSRKEVKPLPQVVLVLDTSGSMWSKHYVNQMLAMARILHREGKLASMYFCDTKLHRVDFKASVREQKVIGGGGTELSIEICEEIQEQEGFGKGWELVYATDEFCPGLEEAKRDKRWKIHVINVPKMLD